MTTNPKIEKINAIYKNFQIKMEGHKKRIRDIVSTTLRKVEQAHAEDIRKSIKE